MHRFSEISAVIFDMDGLVLDTETTYFQAWQKASIIMGYDLSYDFFKSLSGMHYQNIQAKLLEACGADFDLNAFHSIGGAIWRDKIYEVGIQLKRGVIELLDYLIEHDIPYGLATNSLRVNALECLKLGWLSEHFSIIVTRDDVVKGKPDPEMFLKVSDVLNISIDRCLVLEDSVTGIEAASLSGALSVYIPSSEHIDPIAVHKCDFLFKDLLDVISALNYRV